MDELAHIDKLGCPRMVDITEKFDTEREAVAKGAVKMKPSIENIIPNDIEIELRDGEIIYSETGSYTTLPTDTIKKAEGVLQKIGVARVEQINPKFTDGVPIFRLNEAPIKAKCHRQAWQ